MALSPSVVDSSPPAAPRHAGSYDRRPAVGCAVAVVFSRRRHRPEKGAAMDRLLRWVAALLLVISLLAAAACEDTSASPEQRAELEAVVAGYLDALAESYSTLDVKPLEGWASPIEVGAVRRILRSMVTTGDRLEATLRGYDIERVAMFRGVNATVWITEVWDLVRYDAFSGKEKGRSDGSVQQTMLQLRRLDGRWVVIARSMVKEDEPLVGDAEAGG
jgi:hypothetical protein